MFKSKKTVSSILAVFETAKNDLVTLIGQQNTQLSDIEIKQKELADEAAGVAAEQVKALNALGNIKKLMGQTDEVQV